MTEKQKEPLNLIIAGVGGQGNVLISRLIGQAMVKDGGHVTIGETYGASQRGGSVTSHLRISKRNRYGALIPEGRADIVLGLEPLEALRHLALCGGPATCVITNTRPIYPMSVATGEAEYPSPDHIEESIERLSRKAWYVSASDIALDLGVPLLANIVMVGALAGLNLMELRPDLFEGELKGVFSGEKLDLNLRAFRRGLEYKFDSHGRYS
jgi:indolepyruvate ferredoxin oxidoreductase, beta subunit